MSTVGGTSGSSAARPRTRTRPRAVEMLQGTVEVTRTGPGMDHGDVEVINIPHFQGPVGAVRVEGSVTRNVGDYNSVRVAVMVEMPCYPTDAEAERTYAWCSSMVEQKLRQELELALGPPAQQG